MTAKKTDLTTLRISTYGEGSGPWRLVTHNPAAPSIWQVVNIQTRQLLPVGPVGSALPLAVARVDALNLQAA